MLTAESFFNPFQPNYLHPLAEANRLRFRDFNTHLFQSPRLIWI